MLSVFRLSVQFSSLQAFMLFFLSSSNFQQSVIEAKDKLALQNWQALLLLPT
jgi:hypothetical protein